MTVSFCLTDAAGWFAPALTDIVNVAASSTTTACPIDVHISIYVTSYGGRADRVPPIPNCTSTAFRPSIFRLLADLTTPLEKQVSASRIAASHPAEADRSEECRTLIDSENAFDPRAQRVGLVEDGGGLGVCVSGPEDLVQDTSNAIAWLNLHGRALQWANIGLHTESFTL